MQSIAEIIESFALMEDWEDRYSLLIDLGKKLPAFPDEDKIDANLVRGCVSKVWMVPEVKDGRLTFRADSDAHIVKGLVALICIMFNGMTLADIKTVDVDSIFKQLGLDQNLSPNRRNGFYAMIEKIRAFQK